MIERTERLAAEIRAVLGEIIARGEIRDSRVRGAGIITITHIRVTGDLSEARVAFTVFGVDAAGLEQVRRGLQAARAYLQSAVARRLRTRKTAMLSFEVDRSLDHSFRVNSLLRESAAAMGPSVNDAPPIIPDGGETGNGGDGVSDDDNEAEAPKK